MNKNGMATKSMFSSTQESIRIQTISESRLDKWSKYELTDKLDKVIGCCNIMKGDNKT